MEIFDLLSDLISGLDSLNTGVIVIVTVGLLTVRELLKTRDAKRPAHWGKYLNVALFIMLGLFAFRFATVVKSALVQQP